MNCRNCGKGIPDSSKVCSFCGAACVSVANKNETETVPTSVLDFTTNGTPHYVANKPSERIGKGAVIGIVVAVSLVIALITGAVLKHKSSGGGIDTIIGHTHDATCDCNETYELRKATEAVEDGFEEMGLKVSGIEEVYTLDECTGKYFILKGEIYATVDRESEYYDSEKESYVDGFFIAEALFNGSAEWSVYGIYKPVEEDVFESELKRFKTEAEEFEEINIEKINAYYDYLKDERENEGYFRGNHIVEDTVKNYIEYCAKEESEDATITNYKSKRKVSVDGAYYQLLFADIVFDGEVEGVLVAEICVADEDVLFINYGAYDIEDKEDVINETEDYIYEYPDEDVVDTIYEAIEETYGY